MSSSHERVQTGVRIERRLLKVLKAVAEYHDYSLGELLERIVTHSFEGRSPFGTRDIARIEELMKIYDVELAPAASSKFADEQS